MRCEKKVAQPSCNSLTDRDWIGGGGKKRAVQQRLNEWIQSIQAETYLLCTDNKCSREPNSGAVSVPFRSPWSTCNSQAHPEQHFANIFVCPLFIMQAIMLWRFNNYHRLEKGFQCTKTDNLCTKSSPNPDLVHALHVTNEYLSKSTGTTKHRNRPDHSDRKRKLATNMSVCRRG